MNSVDHNNLINSISDFTELRAEEVQELLTRPPAWLLRWGIIVILAVLVLLLVGSWLIHYPDLVRASFRLTSTNAPKPVLAHTDGKIIQLLAQDGQVVRAGTPLAYLESTARHDNVLRLSSKLVQAWQIGSSKELERLAQLELAGYDQLGELQVAYQTFEQAHIQLRAYLANGFSSQQKAMLQQDIDDLQKIAENLNQQKQLLANDIHLADEEYAIQKQLAEQKVIAPLELKREESKNIARKLPYQQTALALINNLTTQRAKQKEMLEINRQVTEERDKFLQALNTLQSAVDAWKLKYVMTAPVGGRVVYVGLLQESQSITFNQELFYVVPSNTNYLGELRVPQQNAGKVSEGQTVLIRFAGYPYEEYGVVQGRISTISAVSYKDSVFLARVLLPNGLQTTYQKTLTQKMGMTATADIITNDTRLLDKLFYQFRKIQGGL